MKAELYNGHVLEKGWLSHCSVILQDTDGTLDENLEADRVAGSVWGKNDEMNFIIYYY